MNDGSGRGPAQKEVLYHGIPASPGIAIGSVLLMDNGGALSPEKEPDQEETITPDRADREVEIFHSALDQTRLEIKEMQKKLQNSLEEREAGIFDAHLLIVDDRMLSGEVENTIRKNLLAAPSAFRKVIQKYIAAISSVSDRYLQERAGDVKDVADRIMKNLHGLENRTTGKLPGRSIIAARDLTPSDTAMLDRENTLGFAIEKGSRTSHTAILARSLQIPAVVGMQHFCERLHTGDSLIIDGYLGLVIVHPDEETLELYRRKMARREQLYAELLQESRMRAETLDGYCIQLCANVENIDGIKEVQRCGAEGIGLFRTEYLYMNAATLPDEETQYQVFRKAAADMHGRPVVIRTLDIGGDKLESTISAYREPNPFLGMRAIRLCRDKPELMRTQMRAILRAGTAGNIQLLFPMVSSVDEIDFLLDMLDEEKKKLMADQKPFNGAMEVGIMVEIPSAAVIAEELASRVDFFSIGSNDLIQYSLAVDRSNEKVAYLYSPTHPAVLRLISDTVKAARKNGIPVCICGEIAADPLLTPLLVGLGISELSMSPASIGPVRRLIRRITMHGAEDLAKKALECRTAADALVLTSEYAKAALPELSSLL